MASSLFWLTPTQLPVYQVPQHLFTITQRALSAINRLILLADKANLPESDLPSLVTKSVPRDLQPVVADQVTQNHPSHRRDQPGAPQAPHGGPDMREARQPRGNRPKQPRINHFNLNMWSTGYTSYSSLHTHLTNLTMRRTGGQRITLECNDILCLESQGEMWSLLALVQDSPNCLLHIKYIHHPDLAFAH